MLHRWLCAVETKAVSVKKTSKAKTQKSKPAKRKKKVPCPADSQITRPKDKSVSVGTIHHISHFLACIYLQRPAPPPKNSAQKVDVKRAKVIDAEKPSRDATSAADADNQERFQHMLRFVNKLFAGDHEKLTLNTIRIMVEKSFSAKEIQALLPRVLYTLDSSNRVMVVVHRL